MSVTSDVSPSTIGGGTPGTQANGSCQEKKLKRIVHDLKKRVDSLEEDRLKTKIKFKAQKLEFKNMNDQLRQLRIAYDELYQYVHNWSDNEKNEMCSESVSENHDESMQDQEISRKQQIEEQTTDMDITDEADDVQMDDKGPDVTDANEDSISTEDCNRSSDSDSDSCSSSSSSDVSIKRSSEQKSIPRKAAESTGGSESRKSATLFVKGALPQTLYKCSLCHHICTTDEGLKTHEKDKHKSCDLNPKSVPTVIATSVKVKNQLMKGTSANSTLSNNSISSLSKEVISEKPVNGNNRAKVVVAVKSKPFVQNRKADINESDIASKAHTYQTLDLSCLRS